MQIALAHDWLTGMRGGEKCLEVAAELLPHAPLLTLLHVPGTVSAVIENRTIHTSPLQNIPGIASSYRHYLPVFPWAASQLPSDRYDGLLSLSHCVVKSLACRGRHLCYCFTPMRYLWGPTESYLADRAGPGGILRPALSAMTGMLASWDRRTAGRVDTYIAISRHIQDRIRHAYRRSSHLLYPPVDTDYYTPAARGGGDDFYLIVSALAPYKRIDLAIRAFAQLDRPLVIIGGGPQAESLAQLAADVGGNIRLLGRQPDEVLRDHYRRCRALIFPGEEDFGITPLEAHACGRPVIAYGVGGACETVVPLGGDTAGDNQPATGLWFAPQTPAALVAAVRRFETHGRPANLAADFGAAACRERAQHFARPLFKSRLASWIDATFFDGAALRRAGGKPAWETARP